MRANEELSSNDETHSCVSMSTRVSRLTAVPHLSDLSLQSGLRTPGVRRSLTSSAEGRAGIAWIFAHGDGPRDLHTRHDDYAERSFEPSRRASVPKNAQESISMAAVIMCEYPSY